ncbi:phosphodiester glycosidase family protein [Luteococcus sanguinis]|uniref:Phosphodiester glycosidase family protein n=1 Tax=Luteococcus sanguinis TaxID=174038 RepID=A0ABW1X5V3_9ACTN
MTTPLITTHAPRPTARVAAAAALAGALFVPVAASSDAAPATQPTPAMTLAISSSTTEQLAPGVTHRSLMVGDRATTSEWVVQLTLPSGSAGVASSAVSTKAIADQAVADLAAHGLTGYAEEVITRPLADMAGSLGYRVRLGGFATQAEATAVQKQVVAAGYPAGTWYRAWDGDNGNALSGANPLSVHVLTVDPRRFRGEIDATYGADLVGGETVSTLAQGALAGINAGFFVFKADGDVAGDPAGAGAYDGKILSETVGDRPALVIDGDTGRASVQRLTWVGRITSARDSLTLDGINRTPGKIRNCGGLGDDPTDLPLHDVTCHDADELVLVTPENGATTPAGEGVEVVLDAKGRIVAVHETRGTALKAGQVSIQGTGDRADALRRFARRAGHGTPNKIKITNQYRDERGRRLRLDGDTQVVNGGPMLLLRRGRQVTARRDGMVQPASPGFFYGWVHQRNPRTIAGVDAQGRLVLATADGRITGSAGLSIAESADLAQALGMVDALNLDGGGSTEMVVNGAVANTPSGGAERPVGDAIVIR